MGKRHSDALYIQVGACNPSAIAHSIADACKEMRAEPNHTGTDEIRRDPAIRLMVHQLAYLMGIPTNENLLDYSKWSDECKAICEKEGQRIPA